MNDLTQIPPEPPYRGSMMRSEAEALSTEVAKILSLVAPVTMSVDQQALWLVSAVDALKDIRAREVADVSAEVRRSITRHQQIVPEIAKLVGERRARTRSVDEAVGTRKIGGPPRIQFSVMDHRGKPMDQFHTDALNAQLEQLGARARYRTDGSRYLVA